MLGDGLGRSAAQPVEQHLDSRLQHGRLLDRGEIAGFLERSACPVDVAGSGVLPELIELAGGPEHVVTIADFGGAQEHGVTFSSGDAGRAVHALAEIGELIESGRFSLPVVQTFPLAEIAQAHRVSEHGHVRGKLVLLVG